MSRRRFRWTREAYRHADWLYRYSNRHPYDFNGDMPLMLRRYHELWKPYSLANDPLLVPVRVRYAAKLDGIPF